MKWEGRTFRELYILLCMRWFNNRLSLGNGTPSHWLTTILKNEMINEIITSKIAKIKSQVVCPVELALRVLGGKWRGSILYQLKDGSLRFNNLKFRVQKGVVDYEDADNFLSNKVLSAHLIELIELDLIKKEKTGSMVIYSLTKKGTSALPILLDLCEWGLIHF